MELRESETVMKGIQTLFTIGAASALSDSQLIEKFLSRTDDAAEVAFAALVERHGPMVLRVCRGVLHDRHASEDAFQATFLILARKARSIRKHGSVASWLFGVARNAAMRAKDQRARRALHERRSATLAENDTHDPDPPVLLAEVQEEVGRLPEKYRAPIVLCYFEGLTQEEAAGQLQLPVGTVKVRLSRARHRLHSRLARRGLAPAVCAAVFSQSAVEAVPLSVMESTINAAVQVATGRGLDVAGPVAALVEGVLNAMFLTKLKAIAAILAASMTLILAMGCIVSALPRQARSADSAVLKDSGDAPLKVAVETVRRANLQRTVSEIGTVHAFESVDVVPRISGYLEQVNVDIGDPVKRGDVLAKILAPELDAAHDKQQALWQQAQVHVDKAKAAAAVVEAAIDTEMTKAQAADAALRRTESMLRIRQKAIDRSNRLLKEKMVISPDDLYEAEQRAEAARADVAEAKAQIAAAKAAIQQAKAKSIEARASVREAEADVRVAIADSRGADIQRQFTQIRAPFDGVVTRRVVHAGDFVRSGDQGGSGPLLTIIRTGKMRVGVKVSDLYVPYLDKGDPVTVRIDSIGDKVYQGTIARTAFAEEQTSQTLRAEIDLDNTDGRLRPGQNGTVTITLEDLGQRLTIPNAAIIETPDAQGFAACNRVDGTRAVRTRIRLGKTTSARAEVVEGLKEGDTVIVQPHANVSDGQSVEPVDSNQGK